MRKFANALIGLGLGIVTLPLAIIMWPAICMWFFWHETDDNANDNAEDKL